MKIIFGAAIQGAHDREEGRRFTGKDYDDPVNAQEFIPELFERIGKL
jgi:hypothetical protein